jgi:hypothetical protein
VADTEGLLYDRSFDDGRGEIKMTEIPLDGSNAHISQFDRETNSRMSWDTTGNEPPHRTYQDYGKHDPRRH